MWNQKTSTMFAQKQKREYKEMERKNENNVERTEGRKKEKQN